MEGCLTVHAKLGHGLQIETTEAVINPTFLTASKAEAASARSRPLRERTRRITVGLPD
jgi:hypothetical protein